MRKYMRILLGTMLAMWLMASCASAQVAILCYHEVDKAGDAWAIESGRFESHLKDLQEKGYHFVSFEEYQAYTAGQLKLPEKSVMITFDDGYRSFYTKVYPLLQKYRVPAMLAIVSSWTDGEGKPTDVGALASWEELRAMEQSGLVTVVSHSHALHKNQAINPQGDLGSVAANHLYINGRYETEAEYASRLANDFARVQELFQKNLGHKAQAMVWPYGLTSGKAVELALQSGMQGTFLLDGGINDVGVNSLKYAKRMIVGNNPGTGAIERLLTKDHDAWNSRPVRMAQVDIDALYDKNPQAFQQNVQDMLERMQDSRITLVALQAFADPDGDGNVDGVYFYNHEVPVTADVFNSVANTLLQGGMNVVAWLPSLTYQSLIAADGSNLVQSSSGEKGWYRRMSPFDRQGEQRLAALYRDLSRYSPVNGILFQDDLYLNDFEDISVYGQEAYQQAFGTPLSALDRNDPQAMKAWAEVKTKRLTELSLALAAAFKENRPTACIMRDIYSEPVCSPESELWFAQNYQDCLKNYDYTVVMAYPYMDKEDAPIAFLQNVAAAVKAAGGMEKTIIKIQSYDWDREQWLSGKLFNGQLAALRGAGVRNLGYYPDTFCQWTGK